MRMNRRSLMSGGVAVALLGALPGCIAAQESKVARGDLVEVGEASYDELFKTLHETLAKAEEDLDGEAALRKAVASAMGLGDDTESAETIKVLSDRSNELKAKGVPISVMLSPEPKVGGKADWAEAIEKVLREGLKRADELAALSAALEALGPKCAEARNQADAKLRPAGIPVAKIREVKSELEDAEHVLADRKLLASNQSGRAARYTLSVARAVDLTAGSTAPPPASPAPPDKKVPPWARKPPAGGGPKPPAGGGPAKPPTGGGPAKPPPPPPPKKPKGDDFDP